MAPTTQNPGRRVVAAAAVCLALLMPVSNGMGQSGQRAPQAPGLFVSFEGDQPGITMASVLRLVLGKAGLLNAQASIATPHTVQEGDQICKILLAYDFPLPCTDEVLGLVDDLNPTRKPAKTTLKIGETISIPAPGITKYVVARHAELGPKGPADPAIKDMLQNWQRLNVEKKYKDTGEALIRFDAYRIFFSTMNDEASLELAKTIADKKDATNVKVDIVPANTKPARQYALSLDDVDGWHEACRNGLMFSESMGVRNYRDLAFVDADVPVDWKKPLAAVPVHVVDGPLAAAPSWDLNTPESAIACRWIKFDKPRHHAGHLAGIVAGRNGSAGFIGLAPNARIEKFDWLKPDGDTSVAASPTRIPELGDTMSNTEELSPLHVYLIASSYSQPKLMPAGTADPRLRDSVATRMATTSNLFVVSAGQADGKEQTEPKALSRKEELAPQNLGDQQSVLVVTACSRCKDQPSLLAAANYSSEDERAVHVAAPSGLPIVGWVTGQEVSAAGGTSQAAAFVAGLAAAMIGMYPDAYKIGRTVKRRIQTTSRPANWSDDDAKKLTAGIVDPGTAMLDPTKHWLKLNGSWAPVPIKSLTGPSNDVRVTNDYVSKRIPASALLRVVRTLDPPQGGCQSDNCRWDLYVDADVDSGGGFLTKKTGTIVRDRWMRMPSGEAITLCDNSKVQWTEIQDLIIAKQGVTADGCKPN